MTGAHPEVGSPVRPLADHLGAYASRARSAWTASGTTPCQSTGVQASDATHSLPHAEHANRRSSPSRSPDVDQEHRA